MVALHKSPLNKPISPFSRLRPSSLLFFFCQSSSSIVWLADVTFPTDIFLFPSSCMGQHIWGSALQENETDSQNRLTLSISWPSLSYTTFSNGVNLWRACLIIAVALGLRLMLTRTRVLTTFSRRSRRGHMMPLRKTLWLCLSVAWVSACESCPSSIFMTGTLLL